LNIFQDVLWSSATAVRAICKEVGEEKAFRA